MIITLHSKGGAVIAEQRLAADHPVPRVGEWIACQSEFENAGRLNFLVFEVYYALNAGTLEANVSAQARSDDANDARGNRLLVLDEQGWLHPPV